MKKNKLTFSKLRNHNLKRCEAVFHRLHDWNPLEYGGAMAGECGETCNLLKKMRRGQKISKKEIAHELADMVIYADLLAASLDIDLGEAVREKFNIVSDRKKVNIKL